MLFDLLVILSFLIVLLLLRRLVNIFPSLVACIWRYKENVNLEASVKLAIDRNIVALSLFVPFCLVVFRFRMYEPGFAEGMSDNSVLGICFAAFAVFVLLRAILIYAMRPKRMSQKTYKTANRSAYTYFTMLTLLLLAAGSLMDFMNVDQAAIRAAMLWISAAIYALFLFRKLQIFSLSCSIFVAFLYLCALEILPMGILVVSTLIF